MDNLHFILNNILTNFFKKLTNYKNDYQQYLNYIMYHIVYLYVYPCGYKLVYINNQNSKKI